jgi:hypothetical protein
MQYSLTIDEGERRLLMELLEEQADLGDALEHTAGGIPEEQQERRRMAASLLERLQSCPTPDRGDVV